MNKPTLPRPSPFAVLALTGVLVATAGAGGAVAGSLVTSKQIKNNTIVSKDVRTGGLNGTDLADNSVAGNDITDNTLGSNDITDGSLAAGDLGTGARQELRGLLASGRTNDLGALQFTRTAPGVTVTSTRLGTGLYCLRLSGVIANADTTGITLTGYYQQDGTSTAGTGSGALIESLGTGSGCADGFRVYTLRQTPTEVSEDDQGFYFQIG